MLPYGTVKCQRAGLNTIVWGKKFLSSATIKNRLLTSSFAPFSSLNEFVTPQPDGCVLGIWLKFASGIPYELRHNSRSVYASVRMYVHCLHKRYSEFQASIFAFSAGRWCSPRYRVQENYTIQKRIKLRPNCLLGKLVWLRFYVPIAFYFGVPDRIKSRKIAMCNICVKENVDIGY